VLAVFADRKVAPPIIVVGPSNKTVMVGDNVTLECEYLSDVEAFVHWSTLSRDVIAARDSDQSQLATDRSSFVTITVCLHSCSDAHVVTFTSYCLQ